MERQIWIDDNLDGIDLEKDSEMMRSSRIYSV